MNPPLGIFTNARLRLKHHASALTINASKEQDAYSDDGEEVARYRLIDFRCANTAPIAKLINPASLSPGGRENRASFTGTRLLKTYISCGGTIGSMPEPPKMFLWFPT
jgi:hypothetical protein